MKNLSYQFLAGVLAVVALLSLGCVAQVSTGESEKSTSEKSLTRNSPIQVTGKKCEKRWYYGISASTRCYDLQKGLEKAIKDGNIEAIKKSIKDGANVNAGYDSSFPPLHFAVAFQDKKEVVALLLDNGADVKQKRSFGETALTTAANYGKEDIEKIIRDFEQNGYRNEWRHKKKIFKELNVEVLLDCVFNTEVFELNIKINKADSKERVCQGNLFRTLPSEDAYRGTFKDIYLREGNLVITSNFDIDTIVDMKAALKGELVFHIDADPDDYYVKSVQYSP